MEGNNPKIIKCDIPVYKNPIRETPLSDFSKNALEGLERNTGKVNPGDADPRRVTLNLLQFFEDLKLKENTKGKVTVYSFGCGKGLEASAFINYFSDRLESFIGYDKNKDELVVARFLNQDPRVFFENKDLSRGLPEGMPDLVIVRNPNVYLYEIAGQNTPNQIWRSILENIRRVYPASSILITTLSEEEAKLANQWIGGLGDVRKNRFPTPLQVKLGALTLDLPAATDAYYIHLKSNTSA